MLTTAEQLQAILRNALVTLFPDLPADCDAPIGQATDARFGDYQTNVAMTLAKSQRLNPRILAKMIVDFLSFDEELVKLCTAPEIAGAGFINFRLLPECLAQKLRDLNDDLERLGLSRPETPRKIVIDFSSPNIAKPMHVGHLRSTILGDCLARVARFAGHEVITDNHLGDWGTQFGKVIYGWKHFLNETALAADPLAELVRVYQQASAASERGETAAGNTELLEQMTEIFENLPEPLRKEVPQFNERLLENFREATDDFSDKVETAYPDARNAADACRAELAKLQSGDPENLAIWQRCVDLSRAELDKIYAYLGVHFDHEFGESHFNPRLAGIVEKLEREGIAQPSEGALVVFFPDNPKLADKPAIIRKRDGAFNYATTDLATYEQRVNEFHANALWYIVGSPQSLHFEQINAIVRRMGYAVPLTHVPFGSILGEDRKIMRTRSGENVALRDLLDEAVERARKVVDEKNADLPEDEKAGIARVIGLGAVKYAELSQHRLTDYIFSWDKMLSFQGNTAPYLQNAYVRIQSIFRRLAETENPEFAGVGELTEPEELRLAKKLAQFAETVPAVLEDFRPNLLANYLYELANDFHGFYEACPVLKAADPARSTRLTLCKVTAGALRVGLGLLGIEVPERM